MRKKKSTSVPPALPVPNEPSVKVCRSFKQSTLDNLNILEAHYGLGSQSGVIAYLVTREIRNLIKAGHLTLPAPDDSE